MRNFGNYTTEMLLFLVKATTIFFNDFIFFDYFNNNSIDCNLLYLFIICFAKKKSSLDILLNFSFLCFSEVTHVLKRHDGE